MFWIAMRNATLARHYWLWRASGADPHAWPLHLAMVRMIYGF